MAAEAQFLPGVLYGKGGQVLEPMRPRTLEKLPVFDIRDVVEVDTKHYPKPFLTQFFTGVRQEGIFPYRAKPTATDYHNRYFNSNGVPCQVDIRYGPNGKNPVRQDVTGFVDHYPYPHDLPEGGDPVDYNRRLKHYHERIWQELCWQIMQGETYMRERPNLGTPIYPLPFNGARIVGSILEFQGVSRARMMPLQAKRVPVIDGSMICMGGGIELPEAVVEGWRVQLQHFDDCLAVGATTELSEAALRAAGAKIQTVFHGGVVGAVHSLEPFFENSQVPRCASFSDLCTCLGPNGYLYMPDGIHMVGGDFGRNLMAPVNGVTPAFSHWGDDARANQFVN